MHTKVSPIAVSNRVPEMAFRFPNRVTSFAGFLLAPAPSRSGTDGSEGETLQGRVISISLKGDVRSFPVVDGKGKAAVLDSVSATEELKRSLTAIQVTSE